MEYNGSDDLNGFLAFKCNEKILKDVLKFWNEYLLSNK